MLTNLENVSGKSFNEYSSDEELSEVNIFFGINGAGKSALSEWIYNNNEPRTMKFDTKFVHDNLRIKKSLNGVKITVGEEVIKREKQIKNIEVANQYIERVNKILRGKIKDNKGQLYTIIDKALQTAKGEFNSTGVNHKSNSRDNPANAIERWKKDSEIDIEVSDDISGEIINEKLEKLPNLISKINPLFLWLTTEYKEYIIKVFNKKIEKIDEEMDRKLLGWLSTGLKVHEMHDETETCKYCGQKFDVEEIKTKITKQIDTEYKESLDEINELKNKVELSSEKIDSLTEIFSDEEISEFKILIDNLTKKITSKSENTDQKKYIREDLKEIEKIDKHIQEKKEEIEEELEEHRRLNSDIELVIKKRVGTKIDEDDEIETILEKITNLENSLNSNFEAIKDNSNQLDEWKDESSDLEPFMRLVNKHLNNLGLDFKLDISSNEDSYTLNHISEEVMLNIKDLSEGETRLLAFLYFYHSSFSEINDAEYKILSGKETIVIDDPITSLDTNNRYYITNMLNDYVKQLVGKQSQELVQVFILTHSSIDFHNICYKFNKKRIKRWNIYKNMDGNSEIKLLSPTEQRNYSDYYKSVMRELIDFSKISKHKLSGERNFLSYGNKGRFILESHARTHYNIENTTSTNIDKIQRCYSIMDEYIDNTVIMLDIINSLSHGISIADDIISNLSAIEVQKAIITLLNILYNKDPQHIDAIGKNVEGYSQFKNNKLYM